MSESELYNMVINLTERLDELEKFVKKPAKE